MVPKVVVAVLVTGGERSHHANAGQGQGQGMSTSCIASATTFTSASPPCKRAPCKGYPDQQHFTQMPMKP